ASRGIHSHVERARGLIAETACWIVELHRRHTEIDEHDVRSRHALSRQCFGKAGKVALAHDALVRSEPIRAQRRFRASKLDRIDIEPDQSSAWPEPLEYRASVTAAAESAVDGD